MGKALDRAEQIIQSGGKLTDADRRAASDEILAQYAERAAGNAFYPDGVPIPSTLPDTRYKVPKPPKKCGQCNRSALFFEGCSLVDCAQRKRLSIEPWGE